MADPESLPQITSEMLLAAKEAMAPLETAHPYLLWYLLPRLRSDTVKLDGNPDVVMMIVQHRDYPRAGIRGGRSSHAIAFNGSLDRQTLSWWTEQVRYIFERVLPAKGWDCTGGPVPGTTPPFKVHRGNDWFLEGGRPGEPWTGNAIVLHGYW